MHSCVYPEEEEVKYCGGIFFLKKIETILVIGAGWRLPCYCAFKASAMNGQSRRSSSRLLKGRESCT
jgi:hypothetical protein